MITETRARRRIRQAVEARGYQVESLEWEPWCNSGEMGGLAGGWSVELDRDYLAFTTPGNDLVALSVEEMLAEVDYWLRPAEPCACDREHSATQAARLIGDPQKPTHGPECEHHIRYRLPWWPKPEGDR